MILDVALSRCDLSRRSLTGRVAAVIDILRASTTMTVALQHGCAGIVPVRTASEARAMARALDEEVLLSGERGASRMAGFSLGNSPAEYSRDRVEGKLVVMTTSNGTRALQAVREALAVIVCSFLNVSAAARWLDRAGLDVVIVCAGRRGRFCLEDAVGSGMLIERVCHLGRDGVELTDAAEAARLLYLAHRQDLAALLGRSEWGRRLRTAGFSADLEVCARVDVTDIVPTLRNGRLVAERV